MLGAIHRCVLVQTYGNWEWIILDDSAQPSAYSFAQSDPRIRYHHVDDDEYYAPQYLEYMVNQLEAKGAHLVKLSAFFYLQRGRGV